MTNLKTFENYSNPYPIMNIVELTKIAARTEVDKEFILKSLRNAFKNDGDDGVIEMFHDITKLKIEPISKGKYIFKYNGN